MKKLMLVLTTLSLLLSACRGGKAPDVSPTADQTSGDVLVAQEKVEIRLWGYQGPAFNQANQTVIEAFMKQNPNVTIRYETFPWDIFIPTLQTSLPAGNAADVILFPGGYTCHYAAEGQLLAVPDDIMMLAEAKEMFYAAPLGGQTCDGKLYGFPAEYNIEYGGAYVNPALFEEAGVPYPPQWKTWEEVVADAQKLTQVDESGIMTVAGLHYTNSDQLFTYFLAGILEQNADYFAEDGRHFVFNSPEAIATIQVLVDMAQRNKVIDPAIFNADDEWVGLSFAEGHTAIGVLGSWYVGEAKLEYPSLQFDYVSLPPMMGSQPRFASVGGWGYVVTKNTQYPEIAWQLAAFLGADQANALYFNVTSATIPAMKAVITDPTLLKSAPFLKEVLPILDAGQYQGDLTDSDLLAYEIIYPTILDAIQGNLTAEKAAQSIHDAANAVVDGE